MVTKEFIDKYFKHHDKLVLYTDDNIAMTVTKAYHFHMNGGHRDFDVHDSQDLSEMSEYYHLSTERRRID